MKTLKLLTIFIALAFIGCSKGDTGATGPVGATGPTGSANVNAVTYTVGSTSWGQSGTEYTYTYSDASLVNATADEVSVSVAIGTETDYFALPLSNFLTSGDEIGYLYQNGSVTFFYFDGAGAPNVNLNFKIVVIPPAQ